MPRPKAGTAQQGRAYQLYKEGLGPTAIFEKLCGEFPTPVSPRTVSTWLRGFRELDPGVTNLDAPFEYHRMGERDLPWEASCHLMEMWAWAREFRTHRAQELDDLEPPLPTVREARWWWRIHLMVPEISKLDVYFWAQAFVVQELLKDVLDESIDMAGLEAKLAYRPWESQEKKLVYLQAIDQMRIPPPPGVFGEYLLFTRARDAIGQPDRQAERPLLGYGVILDRPEEYSMLPSEIFALREADPAHVAIKAELSQLKREVQEREERAKQRGG